MLLGVAAVATLLVSISASNNQQPDTRQQLSIAEQGQITDRYNAAITNLDSRSIELRLGGIYALQRLMQVSPADQPAVVAVLCGFVREQTSSAVKAKTPATDIQAALTVVGARNAAKEGPSSKHIVDLSYTQLSSAILRGLGRVIFYLTHANFHGANLTRAFLNRSDLYQADFTGANLTGANLTGANLHEADLTGALLTGAAWTTTLPLQRGGFVGPARLSRRANAGA